MFSSCGCGSGQVVSRANKTALEHAHMLHAEPWIGAQASLSCAASREEVSFEHSPLILLHCPNINRAGIREFTNAHISGRH